MIHLFHHSCFLIRLFLTENGEVYACGWGADGQTGLGHYNNESSPKQVQGDIEGEKIIKISSRSDCVLAINGKNLFDNLLLLLFF